jgi:hypothetical protein
MSMFARLYRLNPMVNYYVKPVSYSDAKSAALEYSTAKSYLIGPRGPLWGWAVSPEDRDFILPPTTIHPSVDVDGQSDSTAAAS